MDWLEIIKIVGSTAGAAALITATFNLLSLRTQHRRLLEIEEVKNRSSLDAFRYSRIFEALSEIQSFPPINYDLRDMERVVVATTERYGKVTAVLRRVSPLLEQSTMANTTQLVHEEETLSRRILDHLYGTHNGPPLKDLLIKRQQVENSFVAALSENLATLTVQSKRMASKQA